MRGGLAINVIFGLKWRYYGQKKGYFGLSGKTHILVYYSIRYYQSIEAYRVETMDMGRFHW